MSRLPFEKEEEVTELPFERKKKKEEPSVLDKAIDAVPGVRKTIENIKASAYDAFPATSAGIDFFTNMAGDAASGVVGLYKGLTESGKSFVDAGADAVRSTQEQLDFMRDVAGKLTGTKDTDQYKKTTEAFSTPAALGTMAVQGMGALGRLPFQGLEGAVQGLEEPWRNPVTSTVADTAGPLLGYGITGRGAKFVGDSLTKPYNPPKVQGEPLPPEQPKSRLVDPEEVRREGMDVVVEGDYHKYKAAESDLGGELFRGNDLELHQRDADAMAARWKEQKLKDELDAERQRPLDFGLELEPNPLREEARLTDNDRITRGREEFPTMDIDLLPERVSRDTVVKGLITKWNNEQARLRELYRQANETGLEGTRVRAGELGTTKKSKAQINKLREDIATIEKKLDNLSKQLQRRMEVKHNFTYDEGWTGAPLYSGAETRLKLDSEGKVMFGEQEVLKSQGGKAVKEKVEVPLEETDIGVYSEYPPSVRGPAKRTTGLTVEKTERGNMQRSPDANVTGAEMVQKTGRHPLGGVGKKQGGAIDPSVFTDLFPEFKLSELKDTFGKLLPLYHGTSKDKAFNDFRNSDRGIWVTDNPKSASSYAFENDSKKYQYNPETRRLESINNSPRVHQVYVNAQKIYRPTKAELESYRTAKSYSQAQKQLMAKARAEGYDAIDYGDGVYAISDSAQIKSAISPDTKTKLNRGLGGKQSGGLDVSAFTTELGKLFKGRKSTPPSRPAPKANTPITRYMLEDTRSLDQFWKEESPRAGEWKDLSDSLFQKIVQGKFVASMARNLNPVAQFLTSKVVGIDREAGVAKENALWGSKWAEGLRGFGKRIKSDEGALTYLESAKKKDARKVHETFLKYDNADVLKAQGLERPTEQMLRADGLNDAQVKAVNAVYDQINKGFDAVNKMLSDAGKPTINRLPGFIPHMWFGDYRVILKDKTTGKPLDVRGANTMKEVKEKMETMEKMFGDKAKYDIKYFDARKSKYEGSDLSAFQYALGILDKGSKEHQIMNNVYKDIIAHRGFKKHGLQRKGAKGFAGSELTDAGLKDFSKAIEAYINQTYNFIANQKKKQLYGELKKKLDEGKVDLQNTRKFVDEYIDHSTGGMESQLSLIDRAYELAGETARLGPGSLKRGVQNINGLASAFFLSSGKFLEANVVQPLYNWSKLRNIQLDFGGKNPTITMMQAYKETMLLGQASAKTKQGLSYAKRNGFIDAKMLDLMGAKFGTKNLVNEAVYKGAKHTLGWWEQEVVRTPTFVMYDLALRDVIKNDKERWDTAGALTDKYMVDYGKTEAPFFYEKMGTTGEAVRPLKQYGHAYYGQLGEYMKLAVEDKQYSPLGSFLALQTTVGGVKGLPFVGAASALIMAWNNLTGDTVPTVEEMVLASGMSSDFVWGPLSTITGQDISGSVSAPGIEDIWTMPGVSFMLNAGLATGQFAGKMARGTVTDMDVMKTIPKVFPNPHVQALTEKAFSEDGVVPDPNNRGLPRLSNPRTPMEEALRIATGAQLTREQEEKAVANAFKRDNQRSSKVKKEVMDKIVNDFVRKDDLDPTIIDRYMEAGGDPNNIISEIEGHMRNQLFSQLEREVLNSTGMTQLQKIEKLKEYRQILEDAGAEDLVELLRD